MTDNDSYYLTKMSAPPQNAFPTVSTASTACIITMTIIQNNCQSEHGSNLFTKLDILIYL